MKKTKPKKPATKVLRVIFTVRVPVMLTAKAVRDDAARFVSAYHLVPSPHCEHSRLIGKPRVEDVGAR